MQISVFGLGYVGTVCCACLAEAGHDIIGIEPNPTKVALINEGQSPIVEAGVPELIGAAVATGRLSASGDAAEAVRRSAASLISVGTPSLPNGALDTSALEQVCREIGAALRDKDDYHVVVVRSTVLPGTTRSIVVRTLEEASGRVAGRDFGVAVNPEFLREGTAVADFRNPAMTVIGALDDRSADLTASLYDGIQAPLFRTSVELAEMVKYTSNAWHALKVAFGNEIGNVCKALSIDSHALVDIFAADRKLNISAAYLKPGFAFGGSCLPKDVRALTYLGRRLDQQLPVLDAIMQSNRRQVERALDWILGYGKRRIAFIGMSFKSGTDDLRESPYLELIERLIGKGCDIRVYDRNVDLARLLGANRRYLLETIPHITKLMVGSLEEALAHGDLIVASVKDPELDGLAGKLQREQTLLDFARLDLAGELEGRYDGVNW